jgi:hypothetical protein
MHDPGESNVATIEQAADMLALAYRHPQRRNVGLLAGIVLALVLSVAGFLFHGGGQNGTRFAANLLLFSSSFVFVVFYVAGPLSRLIATPATQILGAERFALAYAFAGMMAVFLLSILAPDFVAGARMPLPTLTYALFTALVVAAFLMSAGSKRTARSATMRSLQSVSSGYFWLVFAFTDLDRMVGPHRPDGNFYGLSLLLLVMALLVRFADAFMERRKAGASVQAI